MPVKTQAWVVERRDGPFRLMDVELDDPLADEVLIEMVASGLCHTDFTTAKGLFPFASYPVILGHEGSGHVKAVGSQVSHVNVGDPVLLSFAHCTSCEACHARKPYACAKWLETNFGKTRMSGTKEVGTLADGRRVEGSFFGQSSFGRHALVKATSCVVVGADVDLTALAPMGCGFQTGAGAVINVAQPSPTSSIAISGLGGVGLSAVLAARSMGIPEDKLFGIDVIESRLKMAKSMGVGHAIQAGNNEDTTRKLLEMTGGKGLDFVIEATGRADVAAATFNALSMGGLQVQVGDAGVGDFSVPLGAFLQGLRTMQGCVEGNCEPASFIPQLVKLHQSGDFGVDAMVKKYAFTEFAKAQKDMHSGEVIKPVLVYASQ